ncbi:MAG: gliding motility-associated ABC transporter substrate-binding protein GldG [Bacteroidia bacterium]
MSIINKIVRMVSPLRGDGRGAKVSPLWGDKRGVAITELVLVMVLLVFLNLIFSGLFFRVDMTKEKRYSLSEASKKLARKVDNLMFVKVYLEGEFPAGFKRLSRATKEMLDEFSIYSKGNIQYEFIDPFKDANGKKTNSIVEELGAKGLQPTSVQVKKDDELSQKIIIPGAIFYYKGLEISANFLKQQFGDAPEAVINSSIELLEYEIANVLRTATEIHAKKIAFLDDHGELGQWEVADADAELKKYYDVSRIPLSMVPPQELSKYAGLVIAKPTLPFGEFDKFKLDQYVMNGGKILWLIETQIAEMDSIRKDQSFMTGSYDTKLDDLLFRYGVRVNPNLVQDAQCNAIPILSSMKNGMPQQKLLPWMFFPVASPTSNHPVVKNLDNVWFQFASSIDTTSTKEFKKTVLLHSSPYSRVVAAPVKVDLNLARVNPEPSMFNTGGNYILALLLEGTFHSVFQYRHGAISNPELPFKDKVENNKMIVVSDGDVIRNQRKKSTGEIFPLGYDRYTQQQFGNKRFILNCMDYLCDDSGIIEVRSKEITLRLLNKAKVKAEKLHWQLINMIVPIVLIILFGFGNNYWRRRKYAM